MKKSIILMCILSLLLFNSGMAQRSNYYRITDNSYSDIKISYSINVQNLQIKNIKTEQGNYCQLSYEGMTPTQNDGQPELPVITNLLEIPLCENMQVNVVNSIYETYSLAELGIDNPIMPAQPRHPKSQDGPFPFVIDEATYATNSFYGMPLAESEKVGMLRNINIGRLSVSPFEYNPVTGELRVCTQLDVEITFVTPNIPKTMEMKTKHGNGMFDGQHYGVINPMSAPGYRNEISSAPIKYLIVAHSMFRNNEDLQTFINWKKRIGYLVEIAYTDDSNVGTTTTSIKNFIKAKYDNATAEDPAPTFLLLVGDKQQIPAFTGQSSSDHISDLYYATWTTGDNIPDCYYGRFSAQNVSQLSPQIEKTLMYEQYTMPDPSYLDDAVLVAGTDGYGHSPTHADGQINYIANNYINTNNGYTTVYTHNYNCSTQSATIRAEIGAGVGWANYTAHCSAEGWADPSFINSHVNSMSNSDKYGIMIGNCCESGRFEQSSCFGETLLRASKKGAVIYLGASNSTYWDEDYYWAVGVRSNITTTTPTYNASHLGAYDRIFHTHNEAYSQWISTSAGFNMVGNMAVESSSSSRKLYYWEIYHVFGDPSIKPYLSEPSAITANIPSGSVIGATSLELTAVPYAYVALTRNNELFSAAFADENGQVSLALPSDMIPGQYEIAISAQNYIQFFQTINFASPNNFYAVSNINLNNSETLSNNNVNDWNLQVENISTITGNNVRAKIQALTPNIYFIVDSVYIGTMNGNQNFDLNNAFTSRTITSLSNLEQISVKVTIFSDNGTFERTFNYNAVAPELHYDHATLNVGTANEGMINSGESGTITFYVKNDGQSNISNLIGTLVSNHNDVTVNNSSVNVGSINAGNTVAVTFNISIAANVTVGNSYPLTFSINNNEYNLNVIHQIVVGKFMETFESNNFTEFAWSNGNNPWEITTSEVYAGNYSARSKSNLNNSSSSELSIPMNLAQAGTISYFRKVSSESDWDKFAFYIDGSKKEELSGEVEWGQASFNVSAGNHTFKFVYTKDGSISNGSDCAWIDNIIFPNQGQNMTPTSPILTIDHYDIEGTFANNIVLNGDEPVIKVIFKNQGNTVATNIQATLTTADNDISINSNGTSSTIDYPSMAINSSKTAQYNIAKLGEITESNNIMFDFALSCGDVTTSCPIMLTFLNGENPGPSSVETTTSTSLLIYPNPSSEQIHIQCSNNMKSVEVIDMTGRSVQRVDGVGDSNYILNISNLSQALYFVRVIDENNQQIISKIIKK